MADIQFSKRATNDDANEQSAFSDVLKTQPEGTPVHFNGKQVRSKRSGRCWLESKLPTRNGKVLIGLNEVKTFLGDHLVDDGDNWKLPEGLKVVVSEGRLAVV